MTDDKTQLINTTAQNPDVLELEKTPETTRLLDVGAATAALPALPEVTTDWLSHSQMVLGTKCSSGHVGNEGRVLLDCGI